MRSAAQSLHEGLESLEYLSRVHEGARAYVAYGAFVTRAQQDELFRTKVRFKRPANERRRASKIPG